MLLAVLGLSLAGCGGDTGTDEAGTSSDAGSEATAAEATEAFPRTVQHAMGETTIPEQPERVVVLDTGELDSVTAFGITPVGAVRAPVEDGLLDYLQAETEGTELVGTISEVNLEAVAALRPDLILSSKLRHEDIYDELSQIAPTVFTETVGVVWKDNLGVHAEALGFEEEAAEMLSDYEDRAEALGERLSEERGELPTISMVRFLPDETRLYQKASFIGTVLEDVGLPRPPSQDVDDFALEISAEQLEQADADVIFVTNYGPAEETTKGELTSNPVWGTLSAVQEDDVYEVPDDYWMLGIGIQAANLVLDDIEEHLLAS
ncbi:MAG: iron-siderophore ABC transporter substrate-binding protein [Actinobacteria bacterium]|nr:iron-siderophore ABC transporter substrate-binding protein [Actinomycetota bacterium]